MNNPVPITILGGYLGAGKTTLLNKILSETDGQQITVLVNDFGKINVDAALIENRTGTVLTLTNGCVCCSIGDDLGETLYLVLQERKRPDHIIIEASGAADPAKVGGYAQGDSQLTLAQIITLVDGKTVQKRHHDKFVGRLIARQINSANKILISRGDIMPCRERANLSNWLSAQSPYNEHYFTDQVSVSDLIVTKPAPKKILDQKYEPPSFGRSAIEKPTELDADQFRNWAENLPEHVQRAKGLVTLTGSLDGRHVFPPCRK